MKRYITKQGDCWDLIAYRELGDCLRVKDLMWANRSLLDCCCFPAGVELNIPETEAAPTGTVPPWKRRTA